MLIRNSENQKALTWILVFIFMAFGFWTVHAAEKKSPAPKTVPAVPDDARKIEIEFTGKQPDTRMVKLDDNELMVALRLKSDTDDFRIGLGRQKFAAIRYEKLPGGASAVFIKTHDFIDSFESRWIQEKKVIEISVKTKKQAAIKLGASKNAGPDQKIQKTAAEDSEFDRSLQNMKCFRGGELASAFSAVKNADWSSALGILEEYINDEKQSLECSDAAGFLKAYIFYRMNGQSDPASVRRIFQEYMIKYPDSAFLPYSAMYLGELELSLSGNGPASGYFNYALSEFPDFQARPQALYGFALANISLENLVSAYRALNELSSKYPENPFSIKSSLQQGIIFFKRTDYEEAFKMFEKYLAKNKDEAYSSPDLLFYLGSSAYHTEKYRLAIEYLSKAYNLFPDIKEPDIIFSRIADSYVEEGQLEKARKIYELVRTRYSGTDGFAVSSVRLAGIIDNREEKEGIYREVIKDFPSNPLSKLSMLRLARSRYEAGDYEKSMELLGSLLAEKPGPTKKEADALVLEVTEKYFSSKVSEGKYFDAIKTFENSKKKIEEYNNPKIFNSVGKSYLKLGLYEPAYDNFTAAASAFGISRKPSGFAYDFAVSMHETGRIAEAKHLLLEASSTDPFHAVNSLVRLAEIQAGEGKTDEAVGTYRYAFSKSSTAAEKADILLAQTDLFEKNADSDTALSLISKAADLVEADASSADSEKSFTVLKKLGTALMKKNRFLEASAAFEKAFKLKKSGEAVDEISFLLADSYEKLAKINEASEIFKKISESENDFWAKLAKERLEQLVFYDKLKNPEKRIASQNKG